MGMGVFGNDKKSYFRANIWQWRTILATMEHTGYNVPDSWSYNDREGLDTQEECDLLADKLEAFLKSWNGKVLVVQIGDIRVDKETGASVERGTPNSKSPYSIDREHLQEFVDFLKKCNGFQIC